MGNIRFLWSTPDEIGQSIFKPPGLFTLPIAKSFKIGRVHIGHPTTTNNKLILRKNCKIISSPLVAAKKSQHKRLFFHHVLPLISTSIIDTISNLSSIFFKKIQKFCRFLYIESYGVLSLSICVI